MTTARTTSARLTGALALAALLAFLPQPAAAVPVQGVPEALALDLEPGQRSFFKPDAAESMSRRVETYLVPMLEGMGYIVERMDNAADPVKARTHLVGVKLTIDAKYRYLVHDARRWRGTLEVDAVEGVRAWGFLRVFGGPKMREIAHGPIPRMESEAHDVGGGRPEYDDEEAIARRIAQHAFTMIRQAVGAE